jgi:hypothetical protein
MKSNSMKLISAALFSLLVSSAIAAEKADVLVKKLVAGKGDITMKKNSTGSLELTNVGDDEEGELLVENKDKAKVDVPEAVVAERSATPNRNEELAEAASRAERRGTNDRARSESEEGGARQRDNDFGGGSVGNAGSVGSVGAVSGVSSGGASSSGADSNGAATGAGGTSGSGGSTATTPPVTAAPMLAGDSGNTAIGPNPRPGTEQAVPLNMDTSSVADQERYRNLMAQEAMRSGVNPGGRAAADNPAAVRRYIATDRAAYQRAMGN